MTHFLDISHDVPKTDLDIENLKGIFKNKAWSDLPVIMKLKGNPNFDYKTQYFIQEQSNGNYTLIKHVYLTKQRFPQAKVEACAMGKLYEIAWGHGNKVVERKALQWMLEQTGGLQFRQFSLSTEKKRPVASSAMGTTSTEDDQDAGWDFILEYGERDRSQLKQLRWIHKHINKDGSPIRGWSEKLVQKALDSLANDNCLAKLITRYDLTVQDLHPTFVVNIFQDAIGFLLDHSLWLMGEPGVGKTPLARITAMLFSRYHGGDGNFRTAEDFDFFRGLHFGKSIPALYDDGDVSLEPIKKKKAFSDVGNNEGILKERWTAAKFVQGQLRIVIDNSYAELEVKNPDAASISHDDFVNMIKPAIGHIPSADTRAILKRSVFIVFAKDCIYYRPPSQDVLPVMRMKWVLKDILVDECKPRFNNYKKNGPPPCDFDARVATEKAWLDEALRVHSNKHTLQRHYSNIIPETVIKMEASEFEENHAGLANMCNGEALDVEADSPPPRPVAAPMTPERKIKHEKFEQDYATFLLKSHAWSKSLGANTTIELSPSQSDRAASSLPSQNPIPNPAMSDSEQMDVATSPSESHIFDFGDQVSDAA